MTNFMDDWTRHAMNPVLRNDNKTNMICEWKRFKCAACIESIKNNQEVTNFIIGDDTNASSSL